MNITVIIPIHEYNDSFSSYLTKAVESVIKQEYITELPQIILVFPSAIKESIVGFVNSIIRQYQEKISFTNFSLLENDGKTDYQSQVNLAAEVVSTDYFTVLEFDDEFSTTYFRNAEKYIETYPNVDIFLTMMVEVNEKNLGFKLTNEAVWSQQFVGENGEVGFLNAPALKQYSDFKTSGAIIKKSEFINIGKFKSNILLAFGYEFLLRALNNACKVYSIPKIGYKHLAVREDSLLDQCAKSMSMEERQFWFETALKEANVLNDRVVDTSRLPKK